MVRTVVSDPAKHTGSFHGRSQRGVSKIDRVSQQGVVRRLGPAGGPAPCLERACIGHQINAPQPGLSSRSERQQLDNSIVSIGCRLAVPAEGDLAGQFTRDVPLLLRRGLSCLFRGHSRARLQAR